MTCAYCNMTIKALQAIPPTQVKINICFKCYCAAYVPPLDPLLGELRTAVKAAIAKIK